MTMGTYDGCKKAVDEFRTKKIFIPFYTIQIQTVGTGSKIQCDPALNTAPINAPLTFERLPLIQGIRPFINKTIHSVVDGLITRNRSVTLGRCH